MDADVAYRAGSLPRKLSAGCYGGLELDFACGRGHGFDESWLHGLITQIISAHIDQTSADLRKSWAAPALQKEEQAKGRKREIDFAVLSKQSGALIHAIEAKWANSAYCTPFTILKDVARLAIVQKDNPDAVCLFVLAGGKSRVNSLLSMAPLAVPARRHGLLHYPHDGGRSSFPLLSDGSTNSALSMATRTKLLKNLPMATRAVQSMMYAPSHVVTPNWQVLVWRIYSA